MDGIQGAVLNYKLQYLSEWNNKRFEIAKKYNYGFNNLKNISTPKLNPNSTHIFHLYELKLETKELRSNLINYLNSKNINTGLHYPLPIHKQEPYLYLKYGDTLPITDNLADTLLSLPVYAELTDEQVNYVISNIQDWANTI
jgi:dTDP-4-amino-4,6-dideoxygalactose transaminase